MIAETTFIIDLMKKSPKALKKLKEIEEKKERQLLTTPSVFELVVGITMSSFPGKEKSKVLEILKKFSIIPFVLEDAWISGEILGNLYKEGNPIDVIDCQIAGSAIHYDQVLISRNTKHFEKIVDLVHEVY
jgi:tRNA(fMet)-specific endonuclease VapC